MQGGFDWLKQIGPRSLYGRAALILVLPVVVVTLVVSVVFLQRHFEGVTRQMTASMAREIGLVAELIDAAPDAPAALVATAGPAGPLDLQVALPAAPQMGVRRDRDDFSGRVVAEEMRARVPAVTAVDLTRKGRVILTLDTRHGAAQITFARARVSAANPHQLLVLMVFTALLASGIASIFLRNQLRPIRRLARAAEEFGKGRNVPYRPAGAIEIRSAGAAFLDMRSRIERQIEQRTLMLSGVSHDLRTPLTRLRLGLSMLPTDEPPSPAEIADLERDVDDMARLVDAFLDFTHADAHDRPPEHLPALPFVAELVGDARRAGQPVTLGPMEGDPNGLAAFRPDALRRAVGNLIGNAVRYGSRAEVDAALLPRSLRISVEDDGPGIPADQRDEAQRPFTRLDPSRNQDRGGGVGLGLSIAADIARAHGGQLRLTDGARLGGLRAEIVLPR
ncbi:HAMP domain-containing protein [Paracoccus suum]|uniref:histidine kinase n=1 Tax=Paracoccus suum TaxID=2259340 RepID=A0A344PMT9_9RHOB|nr:ATP-binding protein [Paracoccus suum]AXC50694.1 HAMP domain-containing protein [Paracoccus suum]